MKKDIKEYFDILNNIFNKIVATKAKNKAYRFDEAIKEAVQMIVNRSNSGGKLIFIGNGASAAISSHIATDFWKNAGIRALAFNDASGLTCISNDFGYEYVFEKPIKMFVNKGDILFAISSSGQSKNILLGVKAAKTKGGKVITFSGFNKNNPLRKLGDINFYAPSSCYGHVETVHQAICHCLVDIAIKPKNG